MNLGTIAADLQKEHRATGPSQMSLRKRRLGSLRDAIRRNEALLAEALAADLGKSTFEAYVSEVGFILEEISHTLEHMEEWASGKRVPTPMTLFPGNSTIHPEPYGVVLIISPWNYPFQLCLSPLVGAIAAGNRVVVKPSEFVPKTSAAIAALLAEVFPKNEVHVVLGGIAETQLLLAQAFDYIFFTGSTAVGKIVMRAAAEHLTPLTLELGGKSPCLIEASANLELAARRCAWGKFLNAGQTCVAPDYVLIPRELQDRFIQELRAAILNFYGSEPKTSPDYGRIVSEAHLDRLLKLVDSEKTCIGGLSERAERYLAPTVLRDVVWSDPVMADEIFGPVLPVLPYDDFATALKDVAARPKPLAFYLFTERRAVKEEVLNRVSFGGGCVNDTVLHLANPNLPFGGVGPSGMGSYHGRKTFETFTHYKALFEQTTAVDVPLRYPPYKGKLSWLKLFLR